MEISDKIKDGIDHLSRNDPVMLQLIASYPAPDIQPHSNYYQALVSSIISQQLSVKAAAAIKQRFIDLYGHFPSPTETLHVNPEDLRKVGLSGPKISYIHDLAWHVVENKTDFTKFTDLTNQQINQQLTKIKGIGDWTVDMFLMFSLGRLDILATGDLGIRTAVTRLYGFDVTAKPEDVVNISEQFSWSPFQTVVCWYLWRSLENAPVAIAKSA